MIPGSKGEAKESKPDWPILHVDPKWKERILDIVPARNLLVLMEKEYDVKRDAVLEFLYFFCRPLNRKAVSAVNREILRRKRQVVTITGQIQRLRQSILKAQKEREQPFMLGVVPMIGDECETMATLKANLERFESEVRAMLAKLGQVHNENDTNRDHLLSAFAGHLQARTGTRRIEKLVQLVSYANEAFGLGHDPGDMHSRLRKKIERYFRDPRND